MANFALPEEYVVELARVQSPEYNLGPLRHIVLQSDFFVETLWLLVWV